MTLETLIVYLNGKVSTPTGIRHIFRLLDGVEIKDVNVFEPGQSYVVSSVRKLVSDVPYGDSGEKHWQNKPPSAGKMRRSEQYLYASNLEDIDLIKVSQVSLRSHPASVNGYLSSRSENPISTKQKTGRNMTIVSNTDRDSRTTLYVLKNNDQKFEDLLYDLSQYITINQPPVQTLFTSTRPFKRVCSFTQLFREFAHETNFLACGKEFYPIEIIKKKTKKRTTANKSTGNKMMKEYQTENISDSNDSDPTLSNRTFQTISTQTDEAIYPRQTDEIIQEKNYKPNDLYTPMTNSKQIQNKPSDHYISINNAYQAQNRQSNLFEKGPYYLTIRGKERVIYPPKSITPPVKSKSTSNVSLNINWIYGFNAHIKGNWCMDVINSDEIVYVVSKIIIIYNIARFQQRYFLEHTSRIGCFTIHPTKRYIASAQSKLSNQNSDMNLSHHFEHKTSLIYIWDVADCSVLHVITDSLNDIITSLDFSKDNIGEYLLVLDGPDLRDNNEQQYKSNPNSKIQSMSLWSWSQNSGKKMTSTRCNRERVIGAIFHPDDSSCLLSWGSQHLCVWRVFWQKQSRESVEPIKILRDKKSGLFEFCIPDNVNCVTFDMVGNILSGDTNGTVHLWSRDEEDAFVNRTPPLLHHAHQQSVTCISVIGDGTVVTSAGQILRSWDSFSDFKFVKERHIPAQYGVIKSIIACHPERIDGKLWLATSYGYILEGSLQDSFAVLIQGYSMLSNFKDTLCPNYSIPNNIIQKPLLLVDISPNEHAFVCGNGCMISKWSMLQQKVIWNISIDSNCTKIRYHSDGNYVLLGTVSGRLIVLKAKTGAHVMSLQVDTSQSSICCLSFSPDSKVLLIGCVNNDLRMFTVLDSGAFYRHIPSIDFKGSHNVVKIDWTKSGKYMRTEDGEFMVRIWILQPNLKEIGLAESSSIDFMTDNCLATYQNLNLWRSPLVDELTVTTKTISRDQVIYGTSTGAVGVAPYPLDENLHDTQIVNISAGPIVCAQIAFDDSFVFTVANEGSEAPSMIQWNFMRS